MRLKERRSEFLLLSLCHPPKLVPGERSEMYVKTVQALTEWVEKVMMRAPGRTTYCIAVDLNDGLGAHAADEGSVGPLRPRQEGVAADAFRGFMTNFGLTAATTHRGGQDTLYGHLDGRSWSSRIDYIAVPYAALQSVRAVTTMVAEGRSLQMAKSRHPIDHVPVLCRLEVALRFYEVRVPTKYPS